MKTKITLSILWMIFCVLVKSQVLISMNSATTSPHPSAVFQIADEKRGILFPQIPLANTTDQVTVPTPVQGLNVYNTTTKKFNFWENASWNRNFGIDDGLAIIKLTENFSGNSTASTTINTFPSSILMFSLNDTTAGWTNLNAATTITITKASNTNYIITEGMVQINNTGDIDQQFLFAIGVFVDGQLKLASKYNYTGGDFTCDWKKFNLSGVFNDLPLGTHTVAIYGRNLPKISANYTQITYGGNTTGCTNITDDMARIFVTAQVTQ